MCWSWRSPGTLSTFAPWLDQGSKKHPDLDQGSTQASLNIARGKNWPRLFKKGFQSSHALAVILWTAGPISPLSQSSDQWREAKTSGDKPSLASQQITFRQVSFNIALQQSKGSGRKFFKVSRRPEVLIKVLVREAPQIKKRENVGIFPKWGTPPPPPPPLGTPCLWKKIKVYFAF